MEHSATIQKMIEGLGSKDCHFSCECLKLLVTFSEQSNEVYVYFDKFATMIDDKNSYKRTQGLCLVSANAKWDLDSKVDDVIDEYLKHIVDEKPITSRQCIKALPMIAKYKPDLVNCICNALRNANIERYKSSMKPLIYMDIKEALEKIALNEIDHNNLTKKE